jgi:hypothetical protein
MGAPDTKEYLAACFDIEGNKLFQTDGRLEPLGVGNLLCRSGKYRSDIASVLRCDGTEIQTFDEASLKGICEHPSSGRCALLASKGNYSFMPDSYTLVTESGTIEPFTPFSGNTKEWLAVKWVKSGVICVEVRGGSQGSIRDGFEQFLREMKCEVGHFGLMNMQGEWLLTPRFEHIGSIENGLFDGSYENQIIIINSKGVCLGQAPDSEYGLTSVLALDGRVLVFTSKPVAYMLVSETGEVVSDFTQIDSEVEYKSNVQAFGKHAVKLRLKGDGNNTIIISTKNGKPLAGRRLCDSYGEGVSLTVNQGWIGREKVNDQFDLLHFFAASDDFQHVPVKSLTVDVNACVKFFSRPEIKEEVLFVQVDRGQNVGIYRASGDCIIEGYFDFIEQSGVLWTFRKPGRDSEPNLYGILASDGSVIMTPRFEKISSLGNGLLKVNLRAGPENKGHYGIVGPSGEWLLSPDWADSGTDNSHYKRTPDGFYWFHDKGKRECWLSPTGKVIKLSNYADMAVIECNQPTQAEAPVVKAEGDSASSAVQSEPQKQRRSFRILWLTLVVVLLRFFAPGRGEHELEFINHLESSTASASSLAQAGGRLVTGASLRSMPADSRRTLLNAAGFQFDDYFVFTKSSFAPTSYRAVGVASMIFPTNQYRP